MTKSISIPLAAALTATVILGSAASANAANQQSAPRPTLRVGDRWVYDVKSGIGADVTTYQETREVTAIDASGIKMKVTGKTADGKDFTRVEDLASPGRLRSGAPCVDEIDRFDKPLDRVTFPIAPGQGSAKWVDVISEPGGKKGQFNYYFSTHDWENEAVPAGSFDAIRVDVHMTLNDATAFRTGTTCNFVYWYSPAVRNTVRERRTALYTGTISPTETHVLDATYELASFTPGK